MDFVHLSTKPPFFEVEHMEHLTISLCTQMYKAVHVHLIRAITMYCYIVLITVYICQPLGS